jgi:hypothetical protein
MKKLILLITVLFAAFVINAQNVAINNDGTLADASEMEFKKKLSLHFTRSMANWYNNSK